MLSLRSIGEAVILVVVGLAAMATLLQLGLYGHVVFQSGVQHPCGLKGSDDPVLAAMAQHRVTVEVLQSVLALAPACWMLRLARTQYHLRLAVAFAVVTWLRAALNGLHFYGYCGEHFGWLAPDSLLHGAVFMATAAATVSVYLLQAVTIYNRALAMEKAALRDFGGWVYRPFLLGGLFLAVVLPVGYLLGSPFIEAASVAFWILWAFGPGLFVLGMFKASGLASAAAIVAAEHATPVEAGRAKDAAAAVRLQTKGAAASFMSSLVASVTLLLTTWSFYDVKEALNLAWLLLTQANTLASTLDCLGNGFWALALSGALTGAARSGLARSAAERRRQRRWRESSRAWKARATAGDEAQKAWDEKVHELAGRGFTLEALLKLYRRLGSQDFMPAFDPAASRTRDVVIQALVPESAGKGCPYSELMMGGDYTRPNKMVTHNWSNLFRDLVAAIVADALDEADFSKIAYLLTHDLDIIESWILARSAHLRTYWVCAFSVNQHLSTCRNCSCGLEKALNDSLPLLPDGRGIACEMNKFDDMMRYLSATDADFQQVVAVDLKFVLFSRAWCVAEVAAANEVGMPQHLKIVSADQLAKQEEGLRSLKIQDMQATRPEDKQAILDGIRDVEAFNAALQKLLFEDVIPAWNSLDGGEQMELAGAVLRYHHVCTEKGAFALWQ